MRGLYRTAIHEAGHAVMAVALGETVEYVTIIRQGKSLGGCNIAAMSNKSDSSMDKGLSMLRKVLILIAGMTSGAVILNISPLYGGWKDDYIKAVEIIEAPNDGLESARWANVMKQSFDFFKIPLVQQQVKAVADGLMEHKTLSGEQVKQIMKSVKSVA